ncbi:MAG TPA: cytochrome c biogenesis protein CcsA, partial [Limnochordales bacterium]
MSAGLAGQVALWVTASASTAAALLLAGGAALGRPRWLRWGRGLVLAAFAAASAAAAVLLVSLARDDFSVRYVAQHSSRATPLAYKLGAWWGGQEGSLLFWNWLLLAFTCLVATARLPVGLGRLWPVAMAVLMALAAFYGWMSAALESPFAILQPPPADGAGLNPLLQSPSMLAHPVGLYLGYVGVSVPFAFMVAGLLLGQPVSRWADLVRPWVLASWWFLGIGIVLGGEWAYNELGWGGFWAWDPVENASLVPWLLLTACVHGLVAGGRRRGLARWSVACLAAAFVMVQVGTFVTRSGLLASVHAFAQSPSGPWFLAFVGVAAAFSLWVVATRWKLLAPQPPGAPEREPAGGLGREGVLAAGNGVLAVLAFSVTVGTALPLLTRLVGPGISVQAPYFERVSGPLFAAMLLLMALGLAAPWNPATPHWLSRLAPPATGGLLFVGLVAARPVSVPGGLSPGLLVAWACAFLAGGVALYQLVGGLRWRQAGGLLAHLGVAVLAVSISASIALRTRHVATLAPGQSMAVGAYTLRY